MPREATDAPPLEVFKATLDRSVNNQGERGMIFKVLFNSNYSVVPLGSTAGRAGRDGARSAAGKGDQPVWIPARGGSSLHGARC